MIDAKKQQELTPIVLANTAHLRQILEEIIEEIFERKVSELLKNLPRGQPDNEDLLSVREAMNLLRISRTSLYKLIKNKTVKSKKISGKRYVARYSINQLKSI